MVGMYAYELTNLVPVFKATPTPLPLSPPQLTEFAVEGICVYFDLCVRCLLLFACFVLLHLAQ